MAWQPNLSYGIKGDMFGQRDYVGNLREIWEADKTPSAERQKKLMQARRDMLSWIKDNKDKVHAQGQPGISGGFHDRITQGELAWDWTGTQHENAEISEQNRAHFGRSDELAARAAGHSWTDILGFLDENPDRLGETNVKGSGGLYDELAGHAKLEKYVTDMDSKFDDLIETWGTSFSDLMTDQSDFQQAQLDWQKDESAKARAHEIAMLQESRKVRSATPTHVKNPVSQLAIGPGKVAAPQSASSLARKRLGSAPLVTGLNIGSTKKATNIK